MGFKLRPYHFANEKAVRNPPKINKKIFQSMGGLQCGVRN
jgi:hypothetical protein